MEFTQLLKQRDDSTRRINFQFSNLELGDRKTIIVNGSEYGLTERGLESMVETLDIPKPYANRCPDDFLVDTVNYWSRKRNDSQWSALVDNGNVRAFMKPDYPYVSAYDIWSQIENHLGSDFQVRNKVINDDLVEVIALTEKHEAKVIDSPVQGGIRFLFSDSWKTFPKFDTYLYRLICTNGMVSPVQQGKFRVSGKSRDEVLSETKEFVLRSVDQIPKMIEGFAILAEDEISNISLALKKICNENGLPNKIYNMLMEWSTKPDFLATVPNHEISDMYGIINLITYVASHNTDLSESHREHLFAIGGNAALNHTTRCGSCGGSVA